MLNPTCKLVTTTFCQVSMGDLLVRGSTKRAPASPIGEHRVATALGISSFVWTDTRPFHASRLRQLVQNFRTQSILRSKGWVVLASGQTAFWSHAGDILRLESTQEETVASRVVFIGMFSESAVSAITEKLKRACVDSAQLNLLDCCRQLELLPPSWSELEIASAKDRRRWWWIALALALFTVVYNLCEGAVSLLWGWSDLCACLLGFGVDSFLEVGSSLLVVGRLFAGDSKRIEAERLGAQGIAVALIAMGLVAGAVSTCRLIQGQQPLRTLGGAVVALASLSFMLALYAAKRLAALRLGSRTLEADAQCSLGCVQLSLILLGGSLAQMLLPRLWWADGIATVALGSAMGHEGAHLWAAASEKDFSGLCCSPGEGHPIQRLVDSLILARWQTKAGLGLQLPVAHHGGDACQSSAGMDAPCIEAVDTIPVGPDSAVRRRRSG
mmetsp:Transcript_70504/g.187798  ORF Transcript_70504/g.187798 Transcript_70504/m.187798 type:complete len:442 (-) Transcript_70504:145-1470(-)